MNNIFSFRLPSKPDLPAGIIVRTIEDWVNPSQFYSFDTLKLDDIKGRAEFACSEASLEYVNTVNEEGYGCIGARLSKSDESNVTWAADFICERGCGESYFYIQLSRSIADAKGLANMKILPKMPDVVKQVMHQNMLLDDGDFPIAKRPFALTAAVLQGCKAAFDHKTSPALPIIFVNCVGRPEIKRLIEAAAEDFAGMAHMIVAESDHEISQWREIDSLDPEPWDYEGAVIYFSRISIVKRIPFQDGFEDLLICMTAYFSQQNLSADTMTWDKLKLSVEQRGDSAGSPRGTPLGEYCFVNKQMAELIKTERKKAGLSQVELAKKADTTGLIISRMETLRITRVKRGLLQNIEEALNLSAGTVLRTGDMPAREEESGPEVAKSAGTWVGPVQNVFCRKCGTKLYSDSVFCHQCGAKLPDSRP